MVTMLSTAGAGGAGAGGAGNQNHRIKIYRTAPHQNLRHRTASKSTAPHRVCVWRTILKYRVWQLFYAAMPKEAFF
jgi:hypothetical protein